VGVIPAASIVRIDANQRWNAAGRKEPFFGKPAKNEPEPKSGWSSKKGSF
jgi:hypothetical protein